MAKNTPSTVPPTTVPILPDDNFATISKGKTKIILSTSDDGYTLDEKSNLFSGEINTCLIYAERLTVSKDFPPAPGKNLGLFCNELHLSDQDGEINLNVSGINGTPPEPETSGDGKDGNRGGDAGSIWLFVHDISKSNLSRLKILAVGGNGSLGGATTAFGKTGGVGGAGGQGGRAMLLFGSEVFDTMIEFTRERQRVQGGSFTQKLLAMTELLSRPNVMKGLSQDERRFSDASQLAVVIQHLMSSAHKKEPVATLQKLSSQYSGLYKNVKLYINSGKSSSKEKLIHSLETSESDIQKWISNVVETRRRDDIGNISDSELKDFPVSKTTQALAGLRSYLEPDFDDNITEILNGLVAVVTDKEGDVRQAIRTNPGKGGLGGTSGDAGAAPGKTGSDGASNTEPAIQCRHFGSKAGLRDLEAIQAFAFPDQCQMLLNKANASFFSGTHDSVTTAADIYRRLLKRLSFVPHLKPEAKESALAQAYDKLEGKNKGDKVTLSSKSRLDNIYTEASLKLNRILLGQDMFGLPPDWVPRLSMKFYKQRVKDLLQDLKSTEKCVSDYIAAYKTSNSLEQSASAGLKQATDAKRQINAKISILTDDNGPLKVAGNRITKYTAPVKQYRDRLKKDVATVKDEIQNTYHLDIAMLTDAFTTLSGSTDVKSAIENIGSVAWTFFKARNEVKGADGTKVEKSFVVNQLKTVGDTIESLQESISTGETGTVELADPGAIKLIASKDTLKKLLDQYKNVLPSHLKERLDKTLDEFLSTIETRNEAVLEYNSTLQLLFEAQNESDGYDAQIKAITGTDQLDPALPAVLLWLKQTQDNLRRDIMQRLNFQSRAIKYWGLQRRIPFSSPGPLRGASELVQAQKDLDDAFEVAKQQYAGSIWVSWPSHKAQHQTGLFYTLTPDQIKALKATHSVGKDKVHQLGITFGPESEGFRSYTNIRVNQVRVWLIGATVDAVAATGRRELTLKIIHSGHETILDSEKKPTVFLHAPVVMNFRYDARDVVKDLKSVTSDTVFGTQSIEGDYTGGGKDDENTNASIGPFTSWEISINASENPGLDLSKVETAYMEFWGGGRP